MAVESPEGYAVKVIQQSLVETGEVAVNLPSERFPPESRMQHAARFPPLTGVLMTDPAGSLLVRRVRVRVTSGPDRGRESLLEAGTLLIGTHSDNDLILRDLHASKYHLEIALVAGEIGRAHV